MLSRYCERCERITRDGHLWCQDKDCPAEAGFPVFDYGDYVGDLKVNKVVRVWRTAALYEAARNGQPVLLKVAHAGLECEQRLKREALMHEGLGDRAKTGKSLLPTPRPIRLHLLPPYPTPSKRPYGEITVQGEPKIYCVYQHITGRLLNDLLLESPQLWHYEAAWITVTLAQAMQPLAAQNKLHLSLTPDAVMVEQDVEGHWRPTLLDLGWVLTATELAQHPSLIQHLEPAYTAPEVFSTRADTLTTAVDVYALGLIFYEMLAGHPGFEPKLRRDEAVRQAVVQRREALPVERPELEQAGVVNIVQRAIAPTGRFNTVGELAQAIEKVYAAPPRERRPYPRRTYVLAGALGTLLAVMLCATLFLLMQVWLSS
jgi:serine/threonine protein kinase